jgi:hypothetical protein
MSGVQCESDEFDLEEWMDTLLNVTGKDMVVSVENKTLTVIFENFQDNILKRFHHVGVRSLKESDAENVVPTTTEGNIPVMGTTTIQAATEPIIHEKDAKTSSDSICEHPLCEAWGEFFEYVLKMNKLVTAIKQKP